MPGISLIWKAARELGLRRGLAYVQYQAGLRSGWYRLRVRPPRDDKNWTLRLPRFDAPRPEETTAVPDGRLEALLAGGVEIFGAVPAALDFAPPRPLSHWTRHHAARIDGQDVKFLWEPARFCWTADLIRAHRRSPDSRLADFFAARLDEFMRLNPPFEGPHWASGQEVALRLIHLALAAAVLGPPEGFARTVVMHAARLPPTLAYARAQGNNHLLSEAAGLLTAAALLPEHPQARRWDRLGLACFERGILDQIGPDGAHMQQSTNYHRLVQQLALWCRFLLGRSGRQFSPDVAEKLAQASRWLLERCDPASGAVPNLGPNDGAWILPLSSLPFADHRPVVQAAALAFIGRPAFGPGPWDELAGWLEAGPAAAARLPPPIVIGLDPTSPDARRRTWGPGLRFRQSRSARLPRPAELQDPGILHHPSLDSRAFLRAARFTHRPGHADQLHVDLWWRGHNIALDPGTYFYNAEPPWDNPLQSAFHHNTVTIDGRDQMTRAGRFLYVDRAQARFLPCGPASACAEHDGYRALGATHRRTLTALASGWQVDDAIAGAGRRTARLHWLLPDWPWELDGSRLALAGPAGRIQLHVTVPDGLAVQLDLARAGERLAGAAPAATMGWFSPTYGLRLPALSLSVTVAGALPIALQSTWTFPPV